MGQYVTENKLLKCEHLNESTHALIPPIHTATSRHWSVRFTGGFCRKSYKWHANVRAL
jgi:hypothetical protein